MTIKHGARLANPTRANKSRRITVLTEAEKLALYSLPDFDEFQRAEYFAMTEAERSLTVKGRDMRSQLYCLLQIGYFKAKQNFFRFTLQDVLPEDISFLMQRYFPGETLDKTPLPIKEYYLQRNEIATLFGYRLWLASDRVPLLATAAQLTKLDVSPAFILTEMLACLAAQKIVRPGYTTLQSIISKALTSERCRLEHLIIGSLND